MKYKFFSLAVLSWLVGASNIWSDTPTAANPSREGAAIVEGTPVDEGLAAIVDDEAVTYLEVRQQTEETEKALREHVQGEELAALIKKARLNALNTLIDRLMIVHAFQREGGSIPDDFVQKRLSDIVLSQFSGDEKRFERTLADRGITLDEYKSEIKDSAIIGYMRKEWVTQKVDALKSVNLDDREKLITSTQKAWLDSLRRQSYIKNLDTGDVSL